MTGLATRSRSKDGETASAHRSKRLEVEGLTAKFGAVTALAGISATFPNHGRIGIIGPNGAGKSTLLNVISGFHSASSGMIRLNDRDITNLSAQQRVRLGVVRSFQTVRLLESESVYMNVLLGRQRFEGMGAASQMLSLPGHRRIERRGREIVDSLLKDLGLLDQRSRLVRQLPFGVRRLVEVARVLAAEPSVVLLDEPGAGLDEESRRILVELLKSTHEDYPSTLVVVEHDVSMIKNLCDRAIVLHHGALIAQGSPEQVLNDPEVVKAYIGRADARG